MGPLSKTHRPVAWSIPSVKLAKGSFNLDVEQAVAVIRTGSAPSRWKLSNSAQERYFKALDMNPSIQTSIEQAEEALKDGLTEATGSATAAEEWHEFYKKHCSILVAAAELAKGEGGKTEPELGPKRAKVSVFTDIVERCKVALAEYKRFRKLKIWTPPSGSRERGQDSRGGRREGSSDSGKD
jgi:hypothetical protein